MGIRPAEDEQDFFETAVPRQLEADNALACEKSCW